MTAASDDGNGRKGDTMIGKHEDFSGEPLNDAAVWHRLLQAEAADPELWAQFTDWLGQPGHRPAYEQVEALHVELEAAGEELRLRLDAVPAVRPWRRSAFWLGVGGALAASLLLVLLPGPGRQAPAPQRIATQIGETRKLALADGTQVVLSAATAIEVAIGAGERRITLDRGEALFRVAADPGRPFVVTAGGAEIRDIGTIFDVLRGEARTAVTVAEGAVAVRPAQGAALSLAAGQRADWEDGAAPRIRAVDAQSALSWQNGYLVYEQAPLSQVITDLNRYAPRPIRLADDATAAQTFSGVLQIDAEDRMLDRLAQLMPLAIDRTGGGPVSVRWQGPNH
jgi:transmembrane sensor